MGTACACAAITGAKGETVTFARASTATCTKGGLATTGIANGDLVSCASGAPRVERDAAGYLGLLVEASRVNSLIQSQALDNAAWVAFTGTGGTNPTVSANAVSGPDTTTQLSNPEQVTFAATSGTQSSGLAQAALTAAAYSAGVFAEYVSGTCNLDLCIETNSTGPVATCTATPVSSSTTWVRLKNENVTSIASGRVFIGNLTSLNGGAARSACVVNLWQVDGQAGAYLTSPIYTAASTATRATESASVAFTPPTSANFSAEGYFTGPSSLSNFGTHWMMGAATVFANNSGTVQFRSYGGNVGSDVKPFYQASTAPVYWNGWASQLASGARYGNNALGGTATSATNKWSSPLYFGSDNGGTFPIDGIISRFRIDPDPARCRPLVYAALGDSITCCPSGAGNADGWPQVTQASIRPYSPTLMNLAVYGQTAVYTYNTEWLTQAKTWGVGGVVVLAGTNDLFGGASGATVFTSLQSIYDDAMTNGVQVVAVTVLPRGASAGWTGAMQTELLNLNTLILNYCSTHPQMKCVDAYNSALRTGTNLTPAYDRGDGLHPNAAGEAVLGALVAGALP